MLQSASSAVVMKLAPKNRLPDEGYSRWAVLKDYLPISKETVRRLEHAGRFPRRVHVSDKCSAWSNAEVHRWLANPAGYRAPNTDKS